MKKTFLFTFVILSAAVFSNMAVAEEPNALTPDVEHAIEEHHIDDAFIHVEDGPLHEEGHLEAEKAAEAGADAHHGDDHGKKKGLPQLDPTYYPSQVFWLTFIFLCMYLLFSKKVLPDMSNTIEGRRLHIQDGLDAAEDLKAEAEKVHEAYDEILQDARDKSSSLFVKVEDDIKALTAKKMEKFQARASKDIGETEKQIEDAKAKAMGDMHSIAAETASIAAEKIIGVSTDLKKAETVVKNIDKKAA